MIENFDREFLDFAKSKDANEPYYKYDTANCALAQFVTSRGHTARAFGYGDRGLYTYAAFLAAIPNDARPTATSTWGELVARLEPKVLITEALAVDLGLVVAEKVDA